MEEKSFISHPIYNFSDIQLSLEKITEIENLYEFEKVVMAAVQQGDTAKVSELFGATILTNSTAHLMKRLPSDPLRQLKNLTVVLNTLLRKAAQKGGLPVLYLHTISEKFALMIESAASLDYLDSTLTKAMAEEYAEAVAKFSTSDYSDIVKETIRYLTSNITSDISLALLGEQLGVNPCYLSRIFKEDTGMSITNYINHQRIELSKYYFETEMDHIAEVAFRVGYHDSSYFTKIFKKITGISPKEYIQNRGLVTGF